MTADRRAFYVRCPNERDWNSMGPSMCTGLHVAIPDGLTYDHAVEFACDLVSREFRRYMVHECLRGLGMEPNNDR